MTETSDEQTIAAVAEKHGVSEDAVRVVLHALRRGGGTMAQFSHPEFGGMSQWSRGMTMVGDMFNDAKRAKLDAVASDLSSYATSNPAPSAPRSGKATGSDRNVGEVSYSSKRTSSNWWPSDLGNPHSTGGQNDMRYAIFTNRLAIDDKGSVTIYDTGDHDISGIAQAQGSGSTLTLTGRTGLVRVTDLKRVG